MNTLTQQRYQIIDTLRGLAIVLMFVYHFCFDLNYFHFINTNFRTNPGWINFRLVIVSLFLCLVGVSLVIATRHGINKPRYFKRLGYLVVCSLLVSLSSWFLYPKSFIYFGILHFIAVASVLGLLFTRFYWFNLFLGTGFIVTNLVFNHSLFNNKSMSWIGLAAHKPVTEDYVPLFPWFGVVLIGMFIGKLLFVYQNQTPFFGSLSHKITRWHSTVLPIRILSLAGKHSLLIYMAHQPIFFAVLYPIFLLSS